MLEEQISDGVEEYWGGDRVPKDAVWVSSAEGCGNPVDVSGAKSLVLAIFGGNIHPALDDFRLK